MTSWSLDPVGGVWFTGAIAVLLLLVLRVGPRGRNLAPRRRLTLVALRGITAFLLIVAMLRPTLVTTEIHKLPASLLVLADSSRSMSIADSLDNKSRWSALGETLASAQDQFAELAASWDLKFYQFAAEIEEVKLVDGIVQLPEEATGDQTALGAAIADVLERESQQRVVAMLVLGDGAQRARVVGIAQQIADWTRRAGGIEEISARREVRAQTTMFAIRRDQTRQTR